MCDVLCVTLLCIYTDPDGVRRKKRKPNFTEFINDGPTAFVNPSAGKTICHNPHPIFHAHICEIYHILTTLCIHELPVMFTGTCRSI